MTMNTENRSVEWISVEDRLPEIYNMVLIFEPFNDGSNDGAMHVTFYNGKKPKGRAGKYHYVWPDGQDEQPGSYCPTHWTPLPTPPHTKVKNR